MWACPLQITLAMVFLLQFIGVAAFGGLAWLVIVLSVETLLARASLTTNKRALVLTDTRLELVGQVCECVWMRDYGDEK